MESEGGRKARDSEISGRNRGDKKGTEHLRYDDIDVES